MCFEILAENELLRNERRIFLEKEIDYFSFMCESLKGNLDPFYSWGCEYIIRLKRIMTELETYEAACGETTQEEIGNLLMVDDVYSTLPIVFQNINNAHRIRKYFRIRSGGHLNQPRFALGEIHPDYAQTIRAIECLNAAYSSQLRGFLTDFQFIPPILAVSPSSDWSLYFFPDRDSPFFKFDDPNIDERKKLFDYLLHLSWITLPRWVPIQMRNAAFLSHENFHRVLEISAFAMRDIISSSNQPNASFEENKRFFQDHLYGEPIIKLLEYWRRLADRLFRMLLHMRFPQRSGPPDLDSLALGEAYDAVCLEKLELSAYRCASELLADVGGLMLSGPSLVFSFLCDPSWVNAGVSLAGTRLRTLLHPPMLSRITILCKMLAYYGFEKVDSKCAEMLSQYLGKLRFLDGERRFIEIYEGFINANMPLLREVADFINSSIPECCCGRIRRGQVTEDQWLAEKEDVLQKALNGSFYEVKATPEEVLNTIWYKKIFHPELSHIPAHTAWRIILANHREPTTGGFDGQEDRRGSLCEV